jgi:hypothetical protein
MICLLADCTLLTGWSAFLIGWLNFMSIPFCLVGGLRLLGELVKLFMERPND